MAITPTNGTVHTVTPTNGTPGTRTFGSFTFDELNADTRTLDSIPEGQVTFDTPYTPVTNGTVHTVTPTNGALS